MMRGIVVPRELDPPMGAVFLAGRDTETPVLRGVGPWSNTKTTGKSGCKAEMARSLFTQTPYC